jgi:hypothetical protein
VSVLCHVPVPLLVLGNSACGDIAPGLFMAFLYIYVNLAERGLLLVLLCSNSNGIGGDE